MAKPYLILGVVLISLGIIIIIGAYFIIDSIPLTATGLSMLVAGITCAGLANSRPRWSPEACKLFLRIGIKNTLAILEEFGVSNRAIYLPRCMRDGQSQAIVPFTIGDGRQGIKERISGRMLTDFGTNPEDKAIIITTPGNVSLDLLEEPIEKTIDGMKAALVYILSRQMDIADGVDISLVDSKVNVEIKSPEFNHPLFEGETLFVQCVGSPIASMVAAVCCEGLGKPVKIVYENAVRQGSLVVMLEVLPVSSPIYLEVV